MDKNKFPPMIGIIEMEEAINDIMRDKAKYKEDYVYYTIEDFHNTIRELRDDFLTKQGTLSNWYVDAHKSWK